MRATEPTTDAFGWFTDAIRHCRYAVRHLVTTDEETELRELAPTISASDTLADLRPCLVVAGNELPWSRHYLPLVRSVALVVSSDLATTDDGRKRRFGAVERPPRTDT